MVELLTLQARKEFKLKQLFVHCSDPDYDYTDNDNDEDYKDTDDGEDYVSAMLSWRMKVPRMTQVQEALSHILSSTSAHLVILSVHSS